MESKVAVVTGANKGIGLQIVRDLCRHFGQDGVVYLTARNEGRGLAAVELLRSEGLDPAFHLLDVTDETSIKKLRAHLEEKHGGIDMLINNAGIGDLHEFDMSDLEKIGLILKTNYFGNVSVCRSLMKLVRSGGRIVNVSSTTGYLVFRHHMNEEMRNRFREATIEKDVEHLMNMYLQSCKQGSTIEDGWSAEASVPGWSYAVSKLGLTVMSKLLAKELRQDKSKQDVLLNACCPGFVLTDMTAHVPANQFGGVRVSVIEGADTPVYLARLSQGTTEPHGDFVLRRKVYDFLNTDVFIQV